mmetsp:Transcript_14118/g.21999  ORF Transcript_14118/g.21999 Transcript_14118/m.21999 type:complete len:91 (+) Transcript_14118:1879-2151(+)
MQVDSAKQSLSPKSRQSRLSGKSSEKKKPTVSFGKSFLPSASGGGIGENAMMILAKALGTKPKKIGPEQPPQASETPVEAAPVILKKETL